MELTEITQTIEGALTDLDQCHVDLTAANLEVANARADYELKKNQKILAIKTQEGKQPTAQVITATYREAFNAERLRWQLAEAEAESAKAVHRGVLTKINALQSLLKIKDAEISMSNMHAARV